MASYWMRFSIVIAFFFLVEISLGKERFKWRDLTPDELKAWYTPTDLCALENTDFKAFPQDIRGKNCSRYSKGNRRLHCGVGFGANNKPCYGPFGTARPSFRKGIEGYTDANARPLSNMFKQLIRTNTSLIIVGDSTMRQKIQALECQLLREDYRIRTQGNQFGILPCDTTLNIRFPDGSEVTVIAVSMGPNSVKCLKGGAQKTAPAGGIFENIKSIVERINSIDSSICNSTASLTLDSSKISTNVSSSPATERELSRLRTLTCSSNIPIPSPSPSPSPSSSSSPSGVGRGGRNVLLVANMGLWYNEKEGGMEHNEIRSKAEFQKALPTVLSWLADTANLAGRTNVVAWHETSAQHWRSASGSGYFDVKLVDAQEVEEPFKHPERLPTHTMQLPNCCERITNASAEADWRNFFVHTQLREMYRVGRKSITLLPLADITRPVGDMHTCHQLYKHDCTHYCYWPLLYQPFWHQLEGLSQKQRI